MAGYIDAIEGAGAAEGDKEGVRVGEGDARGGCGRRWGLEGWCGHCG